MQRRGIARWTYPPPMLLPLSFFDPDLSVDPASFFYLTLPPFQRLTYCLRYCAFSRGEAERRKRSRVKGGIPAFRGRRRSYVK